MTEFEHTTEVTVRYGDTDAMGHVNAAVYAAYLEIGRLDYFDAVLGPFPDGVSTVVGSLTIEYRREIEFGDSVSVDVRVVDLGDASFEVAYNVRTSDDTAATGTTSIVVVDTKTGSSQSMPEEWRRRIREFESIE